MDKKKGFMPLKTLEDGIFWGEKTINELEESTASISRGNARTACVKSLKGLYELALSYAKLRRQGGNQIKELENFSGIKAIETPEIPSEK